MALEEIEKATSIQEKLKTAYDQLALAEQSAIHFGGQCNIIDALHQMSIARDRAKHIEDVARSSWGDGVITKDEYLEILFSVEKHLSWDLQENVARQISTSCQCTRKV
jgi:hypothetical protein